MRRKKSDGNNPLDTPATMPKGEKPHPEDEPTLEGQSVSKSPRLFERLKRWVFGE